MPVPRHFHTSTCDSAPGLAPLRQLESPSSLHDSFWYANTARSSTLRGIMCVAMTACGDAGQKSARRLGGGGLKGDGKQIDKYIYVFFFFYYSTS